MNKSKIILAIVVGAAIGGAIALSIKNNNDSLVEVESMPESEPSTLENIAQQFAEKIAPELQIAERKIKSIVSKETNGFSAERELGLFL